MPACCFNNDGRDCVSWKRLGYLLTGAFWALAKAPTHAQFVAAEAKPRTCEISPFVTTVCVQWPSSRRLFASHRTVAK